MTNKSTQNNFWSNVGKIALLLTIIWILIQMYAIFIKSPDYKIQANGNHSPFQLPFNKKKLNSDYINSLAVDSILSDTRYKEIASGVTLINKKFIWDNTNLKSKVIKNAYDLYVYLIGDKINTEEYTSYWWFSIKNTGNKPLEDLILDLPFNGYYQIEIKNKPPRYGNYKQQISIGDLRPSYSASIKVWSADEIYDSPKYIEEKIRITHKYGWEKIDFPKEVKGILAWNQSNNNFPLTILISIILLLFYIVFEIGIAYGPKFKENEKKE